MGENKELTPEKKVELVLSTTEDVYTNISDSSEHVITYKMVAGNLELGLSRNNVSSATTIRITKLEETKYDKEELYDLILKYINALIKDIENRSND